MTNLSSEMPVTSPSVAERFQSIPRKQLTVLLLGPVITLVMLAFDPPGNISPEAWRLLALVAWMVVWWMTEAAPVPVTALLPIPLMPLMDIVGQKVVTANYGHPLIFLFLGGFLIASAMQRWGLHKRIALNIVNLLGGSAVSIIGGFMLATAFLSMWISNTATTVMMFAVGISIIDLVSEKLDDKKQVRTFAVALLLGIAYSASIGGVGTLIGTPPNTLLASFLMDSYGIEIDFSTWMLMGIPIVIIMLPLTWYLLTRVFFPVGDLNIFSDRSFFQDEIRQLGLMSRGERIVAVVFVMTALSWILRKWIVEWTGLAISDTSIAMMSAVLMFVIPASVQRGTFTIEWEATKNIPWGVLFLFGGGLSLAGAFKSTGLAADIGALVAGMDAVAISMYIFVTIAAIIFLTEVTSNTATTATFLPVLGAVAIGLGVDPLVLTVPAALAASMAFMMPVATPPNAIVFSYENLHIADMMKAGLWLNILTIVLVYAAMHLLAPWVFGITL